MRITVPMYEKGRSFLLAAGLLKAYEGHRFVYLHLLCQAFENIGKAILLRSDHGRYGPTLRQDFGHDLNRLFAEVRAAYDNNFLSDEAASDVAKLSHFYKQHQLRYGDPLDFVSHHSAISADCLHAELVALLSRLNREFS